ncbi:hypothetical protein C8A05DRAFT_33294 [Staphylotrichum tortipilum]|uniref:Uncharacterized protein n=1 Tax=Staphylotrichum tortipilum TaxID=2831512 RepID=A0AAN6ML74_9PEZI|nr:hypothetical protein C8A05DRAFT_33294 [Staphylotrichum longicolle]
MPPGRAIKAPFFPHQDETLPDWQLSPHRDHLSPANGMWQPTSDLTSYDTLDDDASSNFDAPSTGTTGWGDCYGVIPADYAWEPPASSSTTLSPYYAAPAWPISPSVPPSSNTWSPNDAPLPSPSSEAPSYIFTSSPLGDDDDLDADPASPATTPQPSPATPSQRTSSVSTSARTPTPALPPPKGKPKKKTSKRPSTTTPPTDPPKPRLGRPPKRRHKFDTPSDAAPPPKTLGGVLPANVDPRVASERIKREAWERCKAEAAEMLQRRMMLRDHEHGALEREAQRLQVNLGLMREKVKGRGRGEGGNGDGS